MIISLLTGNETNAAGLEVTSGQVEIEFARSGQFVLTGTARKATLDGKAVWVGWRTVYRAGQRLVLKISRYGVHGYLAVVGGVMVLMVLGSRGTDLKARSGGLEGRRLQDGDQLKFGKAARRFTTSRDVKQLPLGNRTRALPDPEYHEFDATSQVSLWHSSRRLSPQSDHMGYRLQRQPLKRTTDRGTLSRDLLPGVVQVPHSGQPIILVNDVQTTGGYPRTACIIETDIYQLTQILLEQPVHLVACSLEEVLKTRADRQHYLEQLAWRLHDNDWPRYRPRRKGRE